MWSLCVIVARSIRDFLVDDLYDGIVEPIVYWTVGSCVAFFEGFTGLDTGIIPRLRRR